MARILLIDDDADVRAAARMTLESCGHRVTEARNGAEALRYFGQTPPDILITDIVMPEMDGIEVLMKLRAMETRVKVIAMSGVGRTGPHGYLHMAGLLGAASVLAKPFSGDELLAAVRELLGPLPADGGPADCVAIASR